MALNPKALRWEEDNHIVLIQKGGDTNRVWPSEQMKYC